MARRLTLSQGQRLLPCPRLDSLSGKKSKRHNKYSTLQTPTLILLGPNPRRDRASSVPVRQRRSPKLLKRATCHFRGPRERAPAPRPRLRHGRRPRPGTRGPPRHTPLFTSRPGGPLPFKPAAEGARDRLGHPAARNFSRDGRGELTAPLQSPAAPGAARRGRGPLPSLPSPPSAHSPARPKASSPGVAAGGSGQPGPSDRGTCTLARRGRRESGAGPASAGTNARLKWLIPRHGSCSRWVCGGADGRPPPPPGTLQKSRRPYRAEEGQPALRSPRRAGGLSRRRKVALPGQAPRPADPRGARARATRPLPWYLLSSSRSTDTFLCMSWGSDSTHSR